MADPIELRVGETMQVDTPAVNATGGAAYDLPQAPLAWHALKEPTPGTSNVVAPSVTPDVSGCMIVLIGHLPIAVASGVFSGSEPPVERLDDNTALGLDAAIFADSFVQAVAGATGARTAGAGGGTVSMAATIALTPSGTPGFGTLGLSAKVASGDLVPGEPSGSSVDDIFICILTQRDNVVATMVPSTVDPDSWTQIYGVDLCRRVGQEMRASAWWCRRGTLPPDFTITRPGGNAGIAAIISFGNIFGSGTTLSPLNKVATKSHISVVQDVSDAGHANVKGEFAGTDDAIVYDWRDPFNVAKQTQQLVTVLDADRIAFSVNEVAFDYSSPGVLPSIFVDAYGLDHNTLTSPHYELMGLQWSMPGAVATFVGGVNTGPSVEIAAAAVGSDVITVTGRNSQGQVLTATLQVRVLGAITVSIVRTS